MTYSSTNTINIYHRSVCSQLRPTNHGLQRVDSVYLNDENILLAWNFRRKICVAFRGCFGFVWVAIKAFKFEFEDSFKDLNWERVEHTSANIYILVSGVIEPWVLPMSKVSANLPKL